MKEQGAHGKYFMVDEVRGMTLDLGNGDFIYAGRDK